METSNISLCGRCMGLVIGIRPNDWVHVGYGLCDGTPPACVRNNKTYLEHLRSIRDAPNGDPRNDAIKMLVEYLKTISCDHQFCWK